MSNVVVEDNGGITCEPPAGSKNGDGSDIEAETAEPVLLTNSAPPPFVRRRGRGRARRGKKEGGGLTAHSTEKGAWQQVLALLISDWQLLQISLQISSTCELEVAICCLWCILYFNTNFSFFLLVYCVAACVWMIHDCICLEITFNIFIYASLDSSKIKFNWHGVIGQGIRKKTCKKYKRFVPKSFSSE